MIRTIRSLTRLNNSVNGNPRYRVTFTDGWEAITKSDSSFAYGINNPDMRNVPLRVTLTKAGRIEHLEPTVTPIPDDFPVRPISDDDSDGEYVMRCNTCYLMWDDSVSTSFTPVPSARCPFEYFHK